MIDIDVYQLFLLTSLILVVTPGPDTVLVLSRTVATGGSAGFMTLLGTQTGNIIHALLAGLGVSTLVLMLPWAFTVLKYVGAVYLIYLAVVLWRSPARLELDTSLSSRTGTGFRYYFQGLVNNLVNPKMIPFFIAFFPQFIEIAAGNVALQSLILGITLALMAVAGIGVIVALVARFRMVATNNTLFLVLANKFASVTFLALAARLVVQDD
ncbi:LysE family translocator [Alphaproteobacteria bacterium LSUCC0684]